MTMPPAPEPALAAEAPTPIADTQPSRRWPWQVRGILVPIVMMFGNYVLFIPAGMVVGPMLGTAPLAVQSLAYVTLGLLVPLVAVTAVVLLMRRVDRRPLREAGLFVDRWSLPAFLLGVALSAIAILPAGFALQNAGMLRGVTPSDTALWIVIVQSLVLGLVVQGFPEELLWRGYLMQTLPWRSRTLIALYSAGLFGLMHLVSSGGQENVWERILYIIQAFAFALLAAVLYQATGQLWAAVGIHAGLHFANTLAEQSGVGSGPALWTAQSAVYLLGAVAVMAWQRGRGNATPATPSAA